MTWFDNMVFAYTFDSASDTKVRDESYNERHGLLSGDAGVEEGSI